MRHNEKTSGYLIKINKAYNKKVRVGTLCVKDLVIKTAGYFRKVLSAYQFFHKLEGPYIIIEACNSGYSLISKPDSEDLLLPVNAKQLKLY